MALTRAQLEESLKEDHQQLMNRFDIGISMFSMVQDELKKELKGTTDKQEDAGRLLRILVFVGNLWINQKDSVYRTKKIWLHQDGTVFNEFKKFLKTRDGERSLMFDRLTEARLHCSHFKEIEKNFDMFEKDFMVRVDCGLPTFAKSLEEYWKRMPRMIIVKKENPEIIVLDSDEEEITTTTTQQQVAPRKVQMQEKRKREEELQKELARLNEQSPLSPRDDLTPYNSEDDDINQPSTSDGYRGPVSSKRARCPNEHMNEVEFFKLCRQNLGSDECMRVFKIGEKSYLNHSKHSMIMKDGYEYNLSIQNQKIIDKVVLIKNSKGLFMKVPSNLTFDTVEEMLKTGNRESVRFDVINSSKQTQEKDVDISKFMEYFKQNGDRYNALGLELSGSKSELAQNFEYPYFIKQQSMEGRYWRKMEEIEEELKKKNLSENKRKTLEQKLKEMKRDMRNGPKYLKYVILTMAGLITDVHVDFSGSAVYYHVVLGRKIFYIARKTKENLNTYKKYENGQKRGWLGEALKNEWERIEIGPGETAIIPPGYIHFVYTPEDSIVLGGNFLLVQFIDTHFDLTKFEEEKYVRNPDLYIGGMYFQFRNVMFAYVKHIFMDKVIQHYRINHYIDIIRDEIETFLENLMPKRQKIKDLITSFTNKQQIEIFENLKKLYEKRKIYFNPRVQQ